MTTPIEVLMLILCSLTVTTIGHHRRTRTIII